MTAKRTLIAAGLFVIATQFVKPQRTNAPEKAAQTLQASTPISSGTSQILERSCADCHSDRTFRPWYSNVAPASWLIVNDVNEGRGKLNYSRWSSYTAQQRVKLLTKICEEVSNGEMPVGSYLLVHRHAKLNYLESQALCQWTQELRQSSGLLFGQTQ